MKKEETALVVLTAAVLAGRFSPGDIFDKETLEWALKMGATREDLREIARLLEEKFLYTGFCAYP